MRLVWLARSLVLSTLLVVVCGGAAVRAEVPPAGSSVRLALVVGTTSAGGKRLPTAAADAGLVAEALAQDGFAVTALADPDAETLRRAIATFAANARSAGPKPTIFVYVAGLGVQYAGANFLVTADARIAHQADVPAAAFPLADLARPLEAVPAARRIFVYDLARTTDLGAADGAPLASGLTAERPDEASVFAFDAAPGGVAAVQVPPYGLYARALAEMLRTPGLGLRELFTRVRLRAAEMSGGATIPWDRGDLGDDMLLPPAAGVPTPVAVKERAISDVTAGELYWAAVAEDRLDGYRAFVRTFPEDRQSARLRSAIATRLEALTWSAAVEAATPSAYWTFMQRFPRGPHYVDVRRRLASLHAPLAPPPRFDVFAFEGLPLPTAEETAAVANPALAIEDAEWPQLPPPPSGLLPPPPLAFNVELAPPPLVPAGVLPVPAALPLVAPTARAPSSARIEQPFARHLGRVAMETGIDGTTTVTTDGAPLLKVTSTSIRGDRTIVETDAAGETVSRTTTLHGDATITTIQTGPKGGILSRIFTRIAPDATRATTITDGRNQLVAEVKTDARGVIVGVTRGPAVFDDETFVLASPDRPPAPSSLPAPPPSTKPAAPADRTGAVVAPPPLPLPVPLPPAPVRPAPQTPKSPVGDTALPPRPPMPPMPPLPAPLAPVQVPVKPSTHPAVPTPSGPATPPAVVSPPPQEPPASAGISSPSPAVVPLPVPRPAQTAPHTKPTQNKPTRTIPSHARPAQAAPRRGAPPHPTPARKPRRPSRR